MRFDDGFRIWFNSELYELLNDKDVVQRIDIQQLLWLDDVVRMKEDALARQVFDEGALSSIGVTGVGAQEMEAPGRMC